MVVKVQLKTFQSKCPQINPDIPCAAEEGFHHTARLLGAEAVDVAYRADWGIVKQQRKIPHLLEVPKPVIPIEAIMSS